MPVNEREGERFSGKERETMLIQLKYCGCGGGGLGFGVGVGGVLGVWWGGFVFTAKKSRKKRVPGKKFLLGYRGTESLEVVKNVSERGLLLLPKGNSKKSLSIAG